MARYFHVSFRFPEKRVEAKTLEPVFYQAKDWVRYSADCWVIYTGESAKTWADRLKQAIGPTDSVMVIELKGEYYGYMTKFFWDWYRRDRSSM